MKHALFSASIVAILYAGSAMAADTLPLKRVTLSTSGLAQFEHQGSVTGNADLTLPVRLDQVDDVLKSLVVLDDGGSFGGVSLPGREPLSEIFRDLPFDQNALQSPEDLLRALQGADVTIAGTTPISGKLVSVTAETATSKDGHDITRHRIAVMTKDGLKTTVLEDFQSLQFTEPQVQDQLTRALAAIHAHRVQDQRTLSLSLRGESTRPVTISYVTAAPLWKSAYRLVLPEGGVGKGKTAYLQGWAILENATGQDWNDISVTLLSGNPVTYKQSLYESYFRDRPYLPLRVMDQLMPRTDTGSVAVSTAFSKPLMKNNEQLRRAEMAPAPAMMAMESMAYGGAADMAVAAAPPMAENIAQTQSAITEQATAQMAFRFPQTVTLPAGNSMMLPVISRKIPAEQLWLYQPETNARHPLFAVALKNDSDTGLPPGILTLFEQAATGLRYTGDSELALLPKGETRYVNFALDPATTIDRTTGNDRMFGAFSASKGILRQRIISTQTTTYTVKAPVDETRLIVIELPRRDGWELKTPESVEDDIEKTETHYRAKLALKAGEIKTLKLTLEREEYETLSLGYMQPGDLTARLKAMGTSLDAKTKKAMESALTLQADVFSVDAQMQKLEQNRQAIYNDQARVRGNLQSIPSGSDLAKRYLGELNAQEDQLKKLESDRALLQEKQEAARTKLNDYVSTLEF